MESSVFHAHSGVFFYRGDNDAVVMRIHREASPESEVTHEFTFDHGTWCSIIATMSRYGETDYGWFRAMQFHKDDPIPEGVTLVEVGKRLSDQRR